MSQKVRIVGWKLHGRPYLGDDTDGAAQFGVDPDAVARWLSDAHRTRFNQSRSRRSKYVYTDGVRALDAEGEPVLVPVGGSVTDWTHAQARTECSWLAAAPAMLLHAAQRQEEKSWFAAAKRRSTNLQQGRPAGKMPQFRARKHSPAAFSLFARNGTDVVVAFQRTGKKSGMVSFGGQNPSGKVAAGFGARWKVSIRVRLSQPIRPFTSINVNLDTRELVFTSPVPPRNHIRTGAIVGLDLGVAKDVATSDDGFFTRPDVTTLVKKRKAAQKAMNRSRLQAGKDGRRFWESKRYQQRKATAAALSAKIARIGEDFRHQTTSKLVDGYDLIVIEDLMVRNMTRSAAGTITNPGTRVAQKRGLNRGLASAAPAQIRSMLEYKAAAAGVTLLAVPAHHTSQQCNPCGHIAPENRESQAVFRCTQCGHTAHADTNAAANIRDRGLKLWGQDLAPRVRKRQTVTAYAATAVPARPRKPPTTIK